MVCSASTDQNYFPLSSYAQARRVLARFGVHSGVQPLFLLRKGFDRATWRVGDHVLKWIAQESRAKKVVAVSRYLHSRGVPVVLPSDAGALEEEGVAGRFVLFPWIDGQHPQYTEPSVVEDITNLLAEFHEASDGYLAAGGYIDAWQLDWRQLWRARSEQLDRLTDQAAAHGSTFAKLFTQRAPWLRTRLNWCLEQLSGPSFVHLAEEALRDPALGHGDFNKDNILRKPDGNYVILDMDLVGVSMPVRDLSRLITWIDYALQDWSKERVRIILSNYTKLRSSEEELLRLDQTMPHLIIDVATEFFDGRREIEEIELMRCFMIDANKLHYWGLGDRFEMGRPTVRSRSISPDVRRREPDREPPVAAGRKPPLKASCQC